MSSNETIKKSRETQPQELPTVVIFEDNSSWSRILTNIVEEYPHIVIDTFEKARTFLDQQAALMPDQRIAIAAFIVDGNLSEDAFGGAEGNELIEKIRQDEYYADTIVVGNSGSKEMEGADYNLKKEGELLKQMLPWIEAGRNQNPV